MFENNVVGGLTAYTLPSCYFPSAELYIYDLAVKRTLQRQGIGKKLLSGVSEFATRTTIDSFLYRWMKLTATRLHFMLQRVEYRKGWSIFTTQQIRKAIHESIKKANIK